MVALVAPLAEGGRTLRPGSRGEGVRMLQRRLIALGYLPKGRDGGAFDRLTWHAVVAFQGWRGLPRDGIVGAVTHEALGEATRPDAWGRLVHGLELDLRRQVLLLVARGVAARAIHVSTAAAGYHTPTGKFRVYRRELRSWSAPYSVWLPYALYFSEGHAIHGYDSVPVFPASHGCVRVPMAEAPGVYSFAPVGTSVWVR
jgi:N-acetylmuramoyl-L-alanine amidase